MSVLKNLLDATLSDGAKLVTEARRRVKPYLPLAAELYNELATRSPVSLPKIDVDKLIDDLYPKQDLDPAWATDAEPYVPPTEVDEADEAFDEPADEPEIVEPVVEAVVVEAPKPEPVVAKPEPVVAKPAPVVAKPAPVVAKPEPVVAKPAPVVAKPEPVVAKPEPVVTKPEPVAAKPEPVVAKPAPVVAKAAAKPAAKPKAKPRARKKDEGQQTLLAPAKPKHTLESLLELKKTELLDLARENKLDLKPSATKQAIAEAILSA